MAQRTFDKRPNFKKGRKQLIASGNVKAYEGLLKIEEALADGLAINAAYSPHPLHGKQKGFYGAHPDKSGQWVLVYRIVDNGTTVELVCLGPHKKCYT